MEAPPDISPEEAAKRFAMFSVYQHSIGRQFEIRGASSVVLPPEAKPMDLETALGLLSADHLRFRAAVWLIVRGIPVHAGMVNDLRDYPPALFSTKIRPSDIRSLRREQLAMRKGSSLFAAALAACRDRRKDEFNEIVTLLGQLQPADDINSAVANFSNVTHDVAGLPAAEFAESWFRKGFSRAQQEVQRLEREIGIPLYEFVDNLTGAVAFQNFAQRRPAIFGRASGDILVYPVTSLVRQDTESLVTTATVTTLTKTGFDPLCDVSEPNRWQDSSQVIWESKFVPDPFTLTAVEPPPRLLGLPAPGATGTVSVPGTPQPYLHEQARLAWDRDWNNQTQFQNILYVNGKRGLRHRPKYPSFDLAYSLCRSINSRMLWDQRDGGLEVDEGYVKVRPLGVGINDTWRVTTRKVIRFSDRTPGSGGRGWSDFGEAMNYLAPAAITWWLETETYSISTKVEKAAIQSSGATKNMKGAP